VAAAEGDFDKAVDMYRSHAAQWAAKFGGNTHGHSHAPEQPAEYRGQQGLHQAIEDPTAAARRKR
jgi:hypothetical protein